MQKEGGGGGDLGGRDRLVLLKPEGGGARGGDGKKKESKGRGKSRVDKSQHQFISASFADVRSRRARHSRGDPLTAYPAVILALVLLFHFSIPFPTVIDLKEMGFDGQEPSILKQAREAVQREEPELWDSIFREDPIARKYMEAPETVLKDVMDLTSEFATNLKGKTTLDFGTASV